MKTKQERTYFVGLIKDGETVIVQMVKNKDFLSPQLWNYYGERIITKKSVYKNRIVLLAEINKSYNKNFTKIKIN